MNRFVILLGLLVLTLFSARASAGDMVSLLQLDYQVNEETVRSLVLYGNSIDPNSRSVEDAFVLRVDGERLDVPEDLLRSLAYGRRAYSYDSLSEGIEPPPVAGPICQMAGDAVGLLLFSRYLVHEEETFRITEHAMRPVYGEGRNCLFEALHSPKSQVGRLEAAKALAVLDTILRMTSATDDQ